jgi:hypothetical protein
MKGNVMYRRLILLAIVCLLAFGCATVQPDGDLSATMEQSIEELKNYKLEDYGVNPEDFETMISRIILLGDPVTHSVHGRLRTHYVNVGLNGKDGRVFKLVFSIAKKLDYLGIITVAIDTDTMETAIWYDVDECGVPEIVDTGKGKRAMTDADMVIYAKVIQTLLMQPVYYPAQDGGRR